MKKACKFLLHALLNTRFLGQLRSNRPKNAISVYCPASIFSTAGVLSL